MSEGRNSSSSLAMPLVKAVVEPCWIDWPRLGLLDGFLDHVEGALMDQFVARGLFLLMLPSTAGHPKGALSVDGRGRSDDAIDNGRGLLGSR